jgi:hypothetical protein
MRRRQVERAFVVLLCGGLAATLASAVGSGLAARPAAARPGDGLASAKAEGGSWIPFLSRRSGHNVLYRMRPDGSDLKPIFGGEVKGAPGLAKGVALHREPHWSRLSPDRKYFTRWACEAGKKGGNVEFLTEFMLQLGRADGPGPTRALTSACEEIVAWSPDSKRVAYTVTSGLRWPWSFSHLLNAPPSTRVFLQKIEGGMPEMIFEQPGAWHVNDWSPDGTKLLLSRVDLTLYSAPFEELVEYDLAAMGKDKKNFFPNAPWQSSPMTISQYVKPVLGGQPALMLSDGRYSPDGKWIAATGSKRPDKPGNAYAIPNFELVLIDREKSSCRKVVSYPGAGYGLRGPICWSPDGKEILYSRPLAKVDKRENGAGDAGAPAGLGIRAIRPDGTGERFLTTGWGPEWR